jgi:hypothetical protein
MKTSENGGLIRLLTSFPKSAFWEYMSYETQQMYCRYLPSFLTLLSFSTTFIPVLVTLRPVWHLRIRIRSFFFLTTQP